VADRRYSTARWQRLRKAVLYRDGRRCRIGGPRCVGIANSVHHVVPSSERPDLFWTESNLVASCGPCNYGAGRRVAADNGRRRLEELQQIILEQEQRVQNLLERLAEYEGQSPDPELRGNHPRPAIY
jgi:5-methylcytosine-specific restriction endonuclease McrA